MNMKVCRKCKNEYEATLDNFGKQKNCKSGLRATCKKCQYEYGKKYRETKEGREKKRIYAAKWRENNPDKAIEISRKFYMNNKDRINKNRRERYKNDPKFKQSCIEYDRKYKESGRRYEVNNKPEQREKARERMRIRRLNPIKKQHDDNRNKKWRLDNKEYLKKQDKKRREELAPSYVAYCMRKSVKELTPQIIECKKIIIELRRELKTNNIKII